MTVCEHGMPTNFGCDDCTIARLTARVAELEAALAKAAPQQAAPAVLPEIGSRWTHRNGALYTVRMIANAKTQDEVRYPVTVVYQGDNGKVWSRAASDWHRSMEAASQQEAQEPSCATCGKKIIDGAVRCSLGRNCWVGQQPAPSGDAEDAARYRVIRNSIDLDEILNTVKDPGKWETPYAVLMRGAELDEAVDAARKETDHDRLNHRPDA